MRRTTKTRRVRCGQIRTFNADEILHFRLFSLGGMVGLSPVELHREGLGIARAATKTAGRVFANSSTPGGIMMSKAALDDKDIINARESWNANQTGSNFAKTAFLNGNEWEYIPMTLNLEQLEVLKSRAYQRTEIAAIWGVDPHFLGDTTRLSSSSAEQLAINLVTFTLRPYISQIENEIQRKLLPTQGRKANKYAVQFDVGDLASPPPVTATAPVIVTTDEKDADFILTGARTKGTSVYLTWQRSE